MKHRMLNVSYELSVPKGVPRGILLLTADRAGKEPKSANNGGIGVRATLGDRAQSRVRYSQFAIGQHPARSFGSNDTSSEVFKLSDASLLASYVATDPQVARVSMWPVSRDNGAMAGASYASATRCGVAEGAYGFAAILKQS